MLCFGFVSNLWLQCCLTDIVQVRIVLDGSVLLDTGVSDLRDVWEETGFQLERLQTNRICVEREQELLKTRRSPPYCLTFDPDTCPFTCQPGV